MAYFQSHIPSLIILLIRDIFSTVAHRYGAPLEACNTMMPLHGAKPSLLPPPYLLRVFDQMGNPVTEYQPGDKRAFKEIHGGRFNGFLIQARILGGSGRRVGKFLQPLPQNAQYLNCDSNNAQSTVTHERDSSRVSIRLWWRPPAFNVGPLQFIATVAESKEKFWTWITSPTIYPVTKNLTASVDVSKCGKGFGCFQLGKSGCRSKSSCDFTFSWKCTPDTVIFEFLGNPETLSHNGKSENYAGLGYSLDRKLGDSEVVACIFHEDSTPTLTKFFGGSYRYKRKSETTELVPLKMKRENNKFLCRFERKHKSRSLRKRLDRKGYHFFVHKGGYYSDRKVIPFPGYQRLRLCSHPDLFVETESSGSPESGLRLPMLFIAAMTVPLQRIVC